MAPPLLPTTRLYACPACREHIKSDATVCPHCGAELPARGGLSRAASAVVVSLALTGCGTTKPEPGVTTDGSTTANTSSSTTDGTSSSSGGTETASATEDPTLGEPEYGVPTTTSSTDGTSDTLSEPDYGVPGTTTTTDATTGTSDTLNEPDYGVPGTTDLPEPEYGVPGTTTGA
jgi:hypothetical protein